MGIQYSFQIVTSTDRIDLLIHTVKEKSISKDDLFRLGTDVNLFASFAIAADGALLRYEADQKNTKEGKVSLGLMEVCFRSGTRSSYMNLATTTSMLSQLFEESPNVRQFCIEIGVASDALSVCLDCEDGRFTQLWPQERQFMLPGNVVGGELSDEIDRYWPFSRVRSPQKI